MSAHRNFMVTLDYAHGKTLDELEAEHGLNRTRLYQIIRATIAALGLEPCASYLDIGLAVQRRERASRDFHHGIRIYNSTRNTPEWFYNVVETERQQQDEYFLTHMNNV